MSGIIKPLGAEISIANATSVSNSNLVRVVNYGTAQTLLTIGDASASPAINVATLTIRGNSEVIIEKVRTYTVQAGNCLAIPVAYKN